MWKLYFCLIKYNLPLFRKKVHTSKIRCKHLYRPRPVKSRPQRTTLCVNICLRTGEAMATNNNRLSLDTFADVKSNKWHVRITDTYVCPSNPFISWQGKSSQTFMVRLTWSLRKSTPFLTSRKTHQHSCY